MSMSGVEEANSNTKDIPARDLRVGMFLVSPQSKKPCEVLSIYRSKDTNWVIVECTNPRLNNTYYHEETVSVFVEDYDF